MYNLNIVQRVSNICLINVQYINFKPREILCNMCVDFLRFTVKRDIDEVTCNKNAIKFTR